MLRFVAFIAKEILDVMRQPRLLLLLILGPFLILLLFGVGYTGRQAPVPIVLVNPPDSQLPAELIQRLQSFGTDYPVTVTSDANLARLQLSRGQAEVVAIVPARTEDTLMAGQQVPVELYINAVSPLRRDYVTYVATTITNDINDYLSRRAAEEGLQAAQNTSISPDVVVKPVVTTTENIALYEPTYVGFYAPAVLALLIQHVAITFAALSLVRDRLQGTVELFRVSPLGPGEALVGKFLSYLLLTLAIGLILALLILNFLGIPLFGDPWQFLALMVLQIGASLAWGFFISAISPRESQAVQWAMILLLASVFFSGFFLELAGLIFLAQVVSYSLPVTYAIDGFQQVMLRGRPLDPWYLGALGIMIVVLMTLAWFFYRRHFRLA